MNNEEKILVLLEQHSEMFAQINSRLDKMDERLNRMDSRLDKMDERLDRMEEYAEITRDGVNALLDWVHRKTGFDNIPILQYIICHKSSARTKQTQHLGHIPDILSLCSIHKNKIKAALQCFQHIHSISLYESDLLFFPCPSEILPGDRNSLFVIFNCCDPAPFWCRFTHQ